MGLVIGTLLVNSIIALVDAGSLSAIANNTGEAVQELTFGTLSCVHATAFRFVVCCGKYASWVCLCPGYVVPSQEVVLLLQQYFNLIALAGLVRALSFRFYFCIQIRELYALPSVFPSHGGFFLCVYGQLLLLVMSFNLAGSIYLFFIAFKVSRQIKKRNRDAEMQSLLSNDNAGSSSDDVDEDGVDFGRGSLYAVDSDSSGEELSRPQRVTKVIRACFRGHQTMLTSFTSVH